ncbi:hypothetical protein B1H19_08260 [Streptomyces gilvosporeus]|uniref:Uncharacterized protein n=1 Tax=Streptomyces gilvosporeus TaxID=553510 RepID=A0A1V0TN14_9ACTN|nr:hypothetical protein B1H19_08260 [Streptomyces gilvosporeus]
MYGITPWARRGTARRRRLRPWRLWGSRGGPVVRGPARVRPGAPGAPGGSSGGPPARTARSR